MKPPRRRAPKQKPPEGVAAARAAAARRAKGKKKKPARESGWEVYELPDYPSLADVVEGFDWIPAAGSPGARVMVKVDGWLRDDLAPQVAAEYRRSPALPRDDDPDLEDSELDERDLVVRMILENTLLRNVNEPRVRDKLEKNWYYFDLVRTAWIYWKYGPGGPRR